MNAQQRERERGREREGRGEGYDPEERRCAPVTRWGRGVEVPALG